MDDSVYSLPTSLLVFHFTAKNTRSPDSEPIAENFGPGILPLPLPAPLPNMIRPVGRIGSQCTSLPPSFSAKRPKNGPKNGSVFGTKESVAATANIRYLPLRNLGCTIVSIVADGRESEMGFPSSERTGIRLVFFIICYFVS